MKHRNRRYIASWMVVPALLAVPALVSGLSIWNHWGPQWVALACAATIAILALIVDMERALRWALVGAAVGLVTSPVLLLLPSATWEWFGWWVTGAALGAALLVPLLWGMSSPTPNPLPPRKAHGSDAEGALERLAATLPQRANVD
jgi:hypothetical protein